MTAPIDRHDTQEGVVSTPLGDVLVRIVREGDAEAYRELRLEALKNHPDAFGSDYEDAAAHPPEYWLDRVRNAGTSGPAMFMAWAGSEPVGLCGLATHERIKVQHNADLISMYVRPAWRGVGVGDALIERALDYGRQHGVRIVKLAVVTQNRAAIRLYERHSFVPYGTEPEAIHHNGAYHDMILMSRHTGGQDQRGSAPGIHQDEEQVHMIIRRLSEVTPVRYGNGVEKRVLLGPRQGAPNFVMRVIDVPPGQSSPWHKHEWEHEMFVLGGSGVAVSEAGETPVTVGDAVFAPGNEQHMMKNTGTELLRFVCMVPVSGEDNP